MVTVEQHEFVQVINIGGHWICISPVGCKNGMVNEYDGMKATAITHAARMFGTTERSIKFAMQPIT